LKGKDKLFLKRGKLIQFKAGREIYLLVWGTKGLEEETTTSMGKKDIRSWHALTASTGELEASSVSWWAAE